MRVGPAGRALCLLLPSPSPPPPPSHPSHLPHLPIVPNEGFKIQFSSPKSILRTTLVNFLQKDFKIQKTYYNVFLQS